MLSIIPYQSRTELVRAHPGKNFKLVHFNTAPHEGIEALYMILQKKDIEGTIYQIGDSFWQVAESLPRAQPTECACLQYVGDNPNCLIHGKNSR